MKKIFKIILFPALFSILIFVGYLLVGKAPQAEEITWGVNFSQKYSQDLGLDWKENFSALLDDLKTKNLRIAAHWDLIEPEDGEFYFEDLDWQVQEVEKREAKIILIIGMKTTRWPECHLPAWARKLKKSEQQEKILRMLEKIILRYKDSKAIWAWQAENEPFFPFGVCPWVDKKFVKKEVALIKSLDSLKRPVIMADSGEGSFWIQAAQFGDIASTTMYEKVWFRQIGRYIRYPLPPVFYWRKAQIIKHIFGKKVICGELQAEPFGPTVTNYLPLEEHWKTMNLEQFKKNVDFATKTGLDTFYFWGSEWWYWLKVRHNMPEIWEEAKKLF